MLRVLYMSNYTKSKHCFIQNIKKTYSLERVKNRHLTKFCYFVFSGAILKYDWLIDCCSEQSLVDVNKYKVIDFEQDQTITEPSTVKKRSVLALFFHVKI